MEWIRTIYQKYTDNYRAKKKEIVNNEISDIDKEIERLQKLKYSVLPYPKAKNDMIKQ